MSDYEVTLVNDNSNIALLSAIPNLLIGLQCIFLPFHGSLAEANSPCQGKNSMSVSRDLKRVRVKVFHIHGNLLTLRCYSTFCGRPMESPCRASRSIPV